MQSDTTRVLLIEDDEDDYLIARDRLSEIPDWPMELLWARSLHEGLQILDRGQVAVALLDLSLPDGQGRETFEAVKRHRPDVPIVVLTGLSDEHSGMVMMEAGAQDYLSKSRVTSDQLHRSIRYAIERKKAEREICMARDDLERRVRERTEDLDRANAELQHEIQERRSREAELRKAIAKLEEHNRAKTQFVSNVSHELKTPLTSMGYAAGNLLAGVFGPLPPRVLRYVTMIKQDCERLTRTVNDILDVSRLEAERLELSRRQVPLGRFVRHCVEAFRLQSEVRHLALSVTVNPGTGFVDIDAEKMERVIFNIIQNAVKYSPEGGVVDVRAEPLHGNPDWMDIEVTDSGIGIPEEFLPRVTERYFRVGEHVSGTGLGLSLAKDIVELHGGQLKIFSPPADGRQGTQVSIRLPSAPSPCILVLNHTPALAQLIERQLSADGYRVIVAEDAVPLRDLFERHRVDAAVVDLAGRHGARLDALSQVAGSQSGGGVPCIGLLSTAVGPVADSIIEGLGLHVLQAPWRVDDLLEQVERAVFGQSFGTSRVGESIG